MLPDSLHGLSGRTPPAAHLYEPAPSIPKKNKIATDQSFCRIATGIADALAAIQDHIATTRKIPFVAFNIASQTEDADGSRTGFGAATTPHALGIAARYAAISGSFEIAEVIFELAEWKAFGRLYLEVADPPNGYFGYVFSGVRLGVANVKLEIAPIGKGDCKIGALPVSNTPDTAEINWRSNLLDLEIFTDIAQGIIMQNHIVTAIGFDSELIPR